MITYLFCDAIPANSEGVDMNTGELLRYELRTRGIDNGLKLAEHLGSRAVIIFLRGKKGWSEARAELRYTEDGVRRRAIYRPTVKDFVREECVEGAMTDAGLNLGIDSWARAPFSNCWLPSEDVERLHQEYTPNG